MKNISRKFEYINLKSTSEPILASLKVDGSLKLYKTVRNKSEYIEPNDKNQDNDWNDYKYALKVDRPTATFYLQRTTEQFATFFINFNGTKRKKFEKVITDYFADCKSIIDKVKKKKFKMKHYREIVEYYNTECK